MPVKKSVVPIDRIERSILLIRGQKVMLDADLAELYGVTTKRLNEQVKRNRNRFPKDFMFQLSSKEKDEVVANCDHLRQLMAPQETKRRRIGFIISEKAAAYRRALGKARRDRFGIL